jgi:hypothetical protein
MRWSRQIEPHLKAIDNHHLEDTDKVCYYNDPFLLRSMNKYSFRNAVVRRVVRKCVVADLALILNGVVRQLHTATAKRTYDA